MRGLTSTFSAYSIHDGCRRRGARQTLSVGLLACWLALNAIIPAISPSTADAQPAPPRRMIELLQQQINLLAPPICPETDISVGTTAVKVLNNDPAAIETILYNLGTSNCYRSQFPTVTTTTGQLIAANGGFIEFDWRTDGVIPTQEFWLVCSGAGNNIHAQRCDLQ